MDKQAREAREQMKNLPFKEKWINFWYYHKWHVLAAIIAISVIVYFIIDFGNMIDYDLNVAYYSSTRILDTEVVELEKLLEGVVDDVTQSDGTEVSISYAHANPDVNDQQKQALMLRMGAEVHSEERRAYVFDEKYKDIFLKVYPLISSNMYEISNVPKIKEIFSLKDGERLFWVTRALYGKSLEDEKKLGEYENALKVEKYLMDNGAVRLTEK